MNGRQHNATPAAARDAPELESSAIRTIVPARRRIRVSDLHRDIPVVAVLAARDFKVKYKQSALGPLWLAFQPFALFAGFLVAFRGRAPVGHGIPYVVFALSGLTVWSFFQAAMTIGTASLITNFQLVKFTPCPRIAFPLAGIIASLPSLLIPTIGALIATAVSGTLSPRVLLLPLGFVWLVLLTTGTVALMSSLAVRFRDIISVIPFLLSLGLFLAPVGYPLSGLSHGLRGAVDVNPLTGLLEACRWMMLNRYQPSLLAIGISLVATGVVVIVGWRVFARLETTMADEI
jgi:ABC-type polysaccharide/polyol phosphate export permease